MKYKKYKNKIKKNARNIINKILYFVYVMLIIYNVLYILNNTINNKKYVSIFGCFFIVTEKEDSMKPEIKKNDLIFVAKTAESKIETSDIIGYDINHEMSFHRVISIRTEQNIKYYSTKADNYMHNDLEEKTMEQIKGKIWFKIPLVGFLFRCFENKIITIFIVLILALKISFNRYRHEKNLKMKKLKNKKIPN